MMIVWLVCAFVVGILIGWTMAGIFELPPPLPIHVLFFLKRHGFIKPGPFEVLAQVMMQLPPHECKCRNQEVSQNDDVDHQEAGHSVGR